MAFSSLGPHRFVFIDMRMRSRRRNLGIGCILRHPQSRAPCRCRLKMQRLRKNLRLGWLHPSSLFD